MKISTKGIYAIEAMVDLAIYSKHGVESIKNIAKRRGLSEKYLEQIIGALRKNNLITSTRGASGGYQLAKDLKEISVFDILEAVESSLIPMECLYKETNCEIQCDKCATRGFWNDFWKNIETVIKDVNLQILVKQSELNCGISDIEYYI